MAAGEIRPGDVVWFAPGEMRWHGASTATGMVHIAIQETRNMSVMSNTVSSEDS